MKTAMRLFMLTLSCFITISDCEEAIQLQGYYGGEVAFHCPIDEYRKMKFLYLQKGTNFVNGYYDNEDMEEHKPWLNSRLDRQHNIIYLSGLNISHSGVYTCYFEYEDRLNMEEQHINLTVTANYSEPSVQPIDCPDKHSKCLVQCSSHGGYPNTELLWSVRGVVVNRTEVPDNVTHLFSLSSIAAFNCSTGEPRNISCSVLGIVTDLSICNNQGVSPELPHDTLAANIITLIVVGIVLTVIMFLWCKCRKKSGKNCWGNNGVI